MKMSSLLHKLGSSEAILLMYLADELPRDDRAEVEQMLATDAALRADLERLREVHEMLAGAMSADGGMSRAADETAVRRVTREMKRHQAELALRPKVEPTDTRRAWPLWTVPLASAAAAMFLFIGLWGMGVIDIPGGSIGGSPRSMVDPGGDDGDDMLEEPAEFHRDQFVILDDVADYFEEAAIHVEQLQELDSEDDALLLMKDPV
jgi:hypothetical protein